MVSLKPLPAYRSHKTVHALKITEVHQPDGAGTPGSLHFDGWSPRVMTAEWMTKHAPQAGGYWVRYEDGYESWSPAEAFEKGYTPIDAPHPSIEDINNRFDYHAPPNQRVVEAHERTRIDLRLCAQEALRRIPPSREASLFLTKMEEAMFWANAAIARNHAYYTSESEGGEG